jgi:hypothetical protein
MAVYQPWLRAICSVLLVGLSGCCTARFVSVDQTSAVVAIPNNSNSWPSYHRQHAEQLMREKFPEGYVIDHEEEVVTGSTALTRTNTQTKGHRLLAALKVSPVEEETQQATTYVDQKEWRIWFHAEGAPPAARSAIAPQVPALGSSQN